MQPHAAPAAARALRILFAAAALAAVLSTIALLSPTAAAVRRARSAGDDPAVASPRPPGRLGGPVAAAAVGSPHARALRPLLRHLGSQPDADLARLSGMLLAAPAVAPGTARAMYADALSRLEWWTGRAAVGRGRSTDAGCSASKLPGRAQAVLAIKRTPSPTW
jgi:hypothetical protein